MELYVKTFAEVLDLEYNYFSGALFPGIGTLVNLGAYNRKSIFTFFM
jgi:hypothetical protein